MPPPATPAMDTVAGTRSMLMGPVLTLAVLPAMSDTVPVANLLAPFDESVTSGWQLATPDRLAWSAQVKWTTTGPAYHPLALGAVVAAPVMVGAALSTWTV